MPKIGKETVDSLKEAVELIKPAVKAFEAKVTAETASAMLKACKSYTNRYEGRVLHLKDKSRKTKKK